MKRNPGKNRSFWIAVCLVIFPIFGLAQGTVADYERADSYTQELPKLAYGEDMHPNWIERTHRFWYHAHTKVGDRFFLVDAEKKTRAPVFNHDKLTAALAKASGKEVKGSGLPFSTIKFTKDQQAIKFEAHGYSWTFNLKTNRLEKGESIEDAGPLRHNEDVKSPDGKMVAFIRDYNLIIRSTETAEEFKLSRDGTRENYYDSMTWAPNSRRSRSAK